MITLMPDCFLSNGNASGISRYDNRIGEKDDKKQSSTNNPYTQTEDVLSNPVNPENPDSKPGDSM